MGEILETESSPAGLVIEGEIKKEERKRKKIKGQE